MKSNANFLPNTFKQHKVRLFQGPITFAEADKLLNELETLSCQKEEPLEGPLVLYGKGNLGKLAKAYCKAVGQPVAAHISQGEYYSYDSTVAVCIVNEPYTPIEQSLRFYKRVLPFYDLTEHFKDKHPLNNGWYATSSSPNTNIVSSQWSDDTSRAHHVQFIAWRKAREEWKFIGAPVTTNDRYFIPEVMDALKDNEHFLDIGAHHGDVVREFRERTEWKYKAITAVDPDPYNAVAFQAKTPNDNKTCYLKYTISDGYGKAMFHYGLGYCSQLADSGKLQVDTVPIDGQFGYPSFIKIHIEGHELAALKGAIKTITNLRPILAVTVYHNSDGIWETPLWLMQNCKNYNFHFRNHGWCGTGAVVYAIPKERYES